MKRTGTAKRGSVLAIRQSPLAFVLSLIGKPFFYLFLFFFIGIDETSRILIKTILSVFSSLKKFRLPKIKPPKLSLPKLKIHLPKIYLKLPEIKISLNSISFFFGFLTALFIIYYLLFTFLKDLPSPQKLSQREISLTTKINDRNGILLYKIFKDKNRTKISLNELPPYVVQSTVAIEDKEFFNHRGLSLTGIVRSVFKDVFLGKKVGGSTITQQLIKNTLLTSEKTFKRKIKEAVLAVLVEKAYSKKQILEMYLNEVGYGGNAYGIEEAAQKFFNKNAKDLTLAEAALLAGLPASPTLFSPFGQNPQIAKERQINVLERMVEDGYISEQESKKAGEQELKFALQLTDIKAPHFVMYVKEFLVKLFGEKIVEEGGLEVKTSLDLEIQETAQKIVKEEVEKLGNLHITNGAALITNPKTGEILAMIGSKDYFAKDIDGNVNVTTSQRQPGSSIKPVNYSIALENGFTPASLLDDSPITYKVPGQLPYSPQNYDSRFHGQIPLRIALASSYNVPAVKILASYGVNKMIQRGRDMGITSWDDPSRYGLSLTLGGGEVKMTDMAVVFGVLANSGIRVDLNPILEIKDSFGKILYKNANGKETPVLSPAVSFLLTDILSDNSARTPAFGPNSVLFVPNRQVAVKTGTTQNMRDNWTIGYTPSRLAAVWVGNNDNSPMSYVASGVTGASPIWRKIMDTLLKDQSAENFSKPEEVIQVEICQKTATLPCQSCPSIKAEYFITGTEPKSACSPQWFLPTPSVFRSPAIL